MVANAARALTHSFTTADGKKLFARKKIALDWSHSARSGREHIEDL